MNQGPLRGKVAVVAGATRGAGRGIACMLGEAGAIVYCLGRSSRQNVDPKENLETIEDTADKVAENGGRGIPVCVDLRNANEVESVFGRIQNEQNQLDLLVNNLSGDQFFTRDMLSGEHPVPFWEYPISKGLAAQENGVHTQLITAFHAAQVMVRQQYGLIIEITDGNRLSYNDVGVYYSLSKTSLVMLAHLMAEELRDHNVAVLSLTPGWLRSEKMLRGFGVTESNWRDAVPDYPGFEHSETPFYVGRGVVALARDPQIMLRTGHALSAGYLAHEYGFTDVDGLQPPGYAWYGAPIKEGVFENGCFGPLDIDETRQSIE